MKVVQLNNDDKVIAKDEKIAVANISPMNGDHKTVRKITTDLRFSSCIITLVSSRNNLQYIKPWYYSHKYTLYNGMIKLVEHHLYYKCYITIRNINFDIAIFPDSSCLLSWQIFVIDSVFTMYQQTFT